MLIILNQPIKGHKEAKLDKKVKGQICLGINTININGFKEIKQLLLQLLHISLLFIILMQPKRGIRRQNYIKSQECKLSVVKNPIYKLFLKFKKL